jgi:serine/threonine protein kinase
MLEPQPQSLIAGRYRLVRELGRGGMGVVLEAVNVATERRVAVKWLHADLANNPEAAQRLLREATATCRIRHPNVVDVYDVVREHDAVYLVMELLEGEPLEKLLERGGIPFHQLIALLLPAMRGVAEAHRLGIIHRDIHPANIFLARQAHNERPVPKVLDFGISKVGGDAPSLTRSGTTLGTPLYMSYEQLCNARDVDKRADVYSFGAILYEALTGHPPFGGETFAELAVKIATATLVPVKQLQPAIPTALDRVLSWALERDRDNRIPDLETLIRELEPFAAEHAFRGQMTEADIQLPVVRARASRDGTTSAERAAQDRRPESEPAPLLSPASTAGARIDSNGQMSTPLAQSTLQPALLARSMPPPRRRALLPIVLAVAVVAVAAAAGVLRVRQQQASGATQTSFGSREVPVAAEPAASGSAAPQSAAQPGPAEVRPTAPPIVSEPVAPTPEQPPAGKEEPQAQPRPAKPTIPADPHRHISGNKDMSRAGHAYLKDFVEPVTPARHLRNDDAVAR